MKRILCMLLAVCMIMGMVPVTALAEAQGDGAIYVADGAEFTVTDETEPAVEKTEGPTEVPTEEPTEVPTEEPAVEATEAPIEEPTEEVTEPAADESLSGGGHF